MIMGCRVGGEDATLDNMNTKRETISKRAGRIKIGIDMHQRNYRVVRQIDQSNPEPAQRFARVGFSLWLGKQLGMAEEVVVCYEGAALGMSRRAGCKRWGRRSM